MVTAVTSQLRDGSCLLTGGSQTSAPAALLSGPQTAALTAGSKSTAAAAINKAALTAGSATLKTGAGASAAVNTTTVLGTILGIVLVFCLVAYGVNVIVREYIK